MADQRISDAMVEAAAKKRAEHYGSEYDAPHLDWRDFVAEAREILEAALAPAVAHRWVCLDQCPSTADGEAYLGVPGELVCIKAAAHKSSHVSAEGAMW